MQNKHHHKNLRPFLNKDVKPEDVLSSHAYGSVARKSTAVPSRPILQPRKQAGRDYRRSMVGSLSQYRTAPMQQPKTPEAADIDSGTPIVGNRTSHGAAEHGKTSGSSIERRKHFIEPPKRGFHPYT